MTRLFAIVATVLLAGCPSSAQPRSPRSPEEVALRKRIAHAEGMRGGGVAELVQLAKTGKAHARELALRGIARIGGSEASATLLAALDDKDPAVVVAAMDAIEIAAALEDPDPAVPKAIAAAAKRVPEKAIAVAAVRALGTAGDNSMQMKLSIGTRLDYLPTARASALALGRYGRRKLALEPGSREALVAATAHDDPQLRYAATFALAREHQPPADEVIQAALAARVVDADPETRAMAISGLTRRGAVGAARRDVEDSLRDKDWRVAVEAARALAGEHGDDVGRVIVLGSIALRITELRKGNLPEAHVVIEALRQMITPGAQVPADLDVHGIPGLAGGWIACLAAAVERGDVEHCAEPGALPDHLRLPLLAELVTAGARDVSWRRAALRTLLDHNDARVRAAGLGALASTWKDGDDDDHRATVGTVVSALGSTDPIIAGAAIDAAGSLYPDIGSGPNKQVLDAAVIERARKESDPELAGDLLALIGKQEIAAGADACRAAAADTKSHPVRARAAAECLRALGEPLPPAPPAAAEPPPVDVDAVIGRDVRWHVVTTRGEIVIALDPDAAPWNVATIATLARRGFYDHTEFHRVVPGFVVQGGDPTGTGMGGPGFTTPAEPSSGEHFKRGAVGIADAGPGSGGSQFFIMHAAAPHLDARYTYVGNVVSGQNVADALLIGDQIVKTSVEVR